MRASTREVQGKWVVGDRLPAITVIIRDDDSELVDITGLTLALHVYGPLSSASPSAVVNYAAMTLSAPTVGEALYLWGASDLATAGMYQCRVRFGASSSTYEHSTPFFIEVVAIGDHPDEAN